MRLVNVHTLELKEFLNEKDIREIGYAVLSHRWEEEEVSLDDVRSGRMTAMKGFGKLQRCCETARSEGFEWVWIDTCCIDKSSSAELSEAINSMFRWYQYASVCYVFLSDVEGMEDFAGSKWFTRGWTLQELLAPSDVVFLNRSWYQLGTKRHLSGKIQAITNISADALQMRKSLSDFLTVEKMAWAAGRETTRVEDEAYCLMGLFDVNMPLLYGEGRKAFQRLQEEIMKQTNDLSLLAWTRNEQDDSRLLAERPAQFSHVVRPLTDERTISLLTTMVNTFELAGQIVKVRGWYARGHLREVPASRTTRLGQPPQAPVALAGEIWLRHDWTADLYARHPRRQRPEYMFRANAAGDHAILVIEYCEANYDAVGVLLKGSVEAYHQFQTDEPVRALLEGSVAAFHRVHPGTVSFDVSFVSNCQVTVLPLRLAVGPRTLGGLPPEGQQYRPKFHYRLLPRDDDPAGHGYSMHMYDRAPDLTCPAAPPGFVAGWYDHFETFHTAELWFMYEDDTATNGHGEVLVFKNRSAAKEPFLLAFGFPPATTEDKNSPVLHDRPFVGFRRGHDVLGKPFRVMPDMIPEPCFFFLEQHNHVSVVIRSGAKREFSVLIRIT